MANLYGSMTGERGTVTKCGRSNLSAHVRGWNYGVEVEAVYDGSEPVFDIYTTPGSSGAGPRIRVGQVEHGVFRRVVNGVLKD